MIYYKIKVELGHLGAAKSVECWVYVYGKNAYDAMKYAQNIPAVKHSKIPKLIEITKEEYLQNINNEDYYKKMDAINNV